MQQICADASSRGGRRRCHGCSGRDQHPFIATWVRMDVVRPPSCDAPPDVFGIHEWLRVVSRTTHDASGLKLEKMGRQLLDEVHTTKFLDAFFSVVQCRSQCNTAMRTVFIGSTSVSTGSTRAPDKSHQEIESRGRERTRTCSVGGGTEKVCASATTNGSRSFQKKVLQEQQRTHTTVPFRVTLAIVKLHFPRGKR
ncbi:hypothetical protein H310_05668 [Aphanomyces invadans]|uniref:Uncharacterized protein n=1 Tax=Aphanomyces invadans TaxID=157072 RepID=A0A024U707_9STRA|nr:hypothetical protein H310_05668 [Aphanomyces invadans]ETW02054.1 hypothetical protein H310_05668 [Aphanomyces invadans]|eukprot:XP_008868659.1 hypothetical protein H310_05668 [Aphanomyces invadans]